MQPLPRISVVTSSFNQGDYIARTIESVLAQDYPDLEHIVVDGMSTDETPSVLAKYPHLRVIREPDRGQADAINKGFRVATGDIFCFLNSDDTFFPGTFHRVAREIDPSKGRHVVQGRCLYMDEHDELTGQEHPSRPMSYWRILQAWNTYCVPQPAVFWTPEVWRRCGPLDESLHLALDYDLFCRFRRHYRFHHVDMLFASYRLHQSSKTCSEDASEVTDKTIEISKRYFGSRFGPRYWFLYASLARRQCLIAMRQYLHRIHASNRRLTILERLGDRLTRLLLYPRSTPRKFLPRPLIPLWDWLVGFPRSRRSLDRWQEIRPEVQVWRPFVGMHPDRMVGPVFETELLFGDQHNAVNLEVERPWPEGCSAPGPVAFQVLLDDETVCTHKSKQATPIRLTIPLPDVSRGNHRLAIISESFLTAEDFSRWENLYSAPYDYRPLSLRLNRLEPTTIAKDSSDASSSRAA